MASEKKKALTVMKFGGTSLATVERIREVAARVAEERAAGKDVIVVVSAMGDTTDELFGLARTISPNPPKREVDMLLTAGERISMALLSMAINELGYASISFTGSQSGIVTDTSHTRAKILDVRAFRVKDELEKDRVVIVSGFQGVSPAKEVTTLGRGGSDTTCVALAAAFGADACEIYTDVDGVFTADPRLVPWAVKIQKISYEEMHEMSFCGAQVLHTRSVEVARRYGVRVHVRSSFTGEPGTLVTSRDEAGPVGIRGIAHDPDAVLISFGCAQAPDGQARRLIHALGGNDISLRLACASGGPAGGDRPHFLVSGEDRESALEALRTHLAGMDFRMDESVAAVSVIGSGISELAGARGKVLGSLGDLGIRPAAVSMSGLVLTVAIRADRAREAVRRLHADLGLGEPIRSEGQQSGQA